MTELDETVNMPNGVMHEDLTFPTHRGSEDMIASDTVQPSRQGVTGVSNMYRSMASNLEQLYAKPNKRGARLSGGDTEIVENELYSTA